MAMRNGQRATSSAPRVLILGKKIPERLVKWFAASVFIIFGVLGIYSVCPKDFWTPPVWIGSLLLLLSLIHGVVSMNKKRRGKE